MLRGVFAWEKGFRELEGLTLYAPHHIAFPKGAEAAASFLIAKIPSLLYNR